MTNNTEDRKRVLELLAQGKITVDEANQLLDAFKGRAEAGASTEDHNDSSSRSPRWMRITIDRAPRDGRPAKQVSIRVPLTFARSGMRLGAIIPHLAGARVHERLRDQGLDIDWSKIDFSKFDTLLNDLGETTIDVDNGRAQVRIRCE